MTAHEQFADDLALYALGSLTGDERTALREHLAQCAKCRAEWERVEGDVALLAISASDPMPPSRARARLMSAIAKAPRTKESSPSPRLRWWTLAPLGAAVVLLLLLSLVLWQENKTLRREHEQLLAQSEQSHREAARAQQILAVLTAADAQHITLVANNAKPLPQGKAIYVPRTGSLVFVASNFAPVPPNKAYELWLLPASGEPPIPAGVFKPDSKGSASVLMPPLPKDVAAKAFAVTVEPEGGSTTPTMPIMLVGTP